MQGINYIEKFDSVSSQNVNDLIYLGITSNSPIKKNPVLEMLIGEGCETFVDYIEWLGLSKDPNLVILSSIYHYYYDSEEMKDVKTVINLKELNHVKETKSFLHSIFHILSSQSNFIGCFIDNENIDIYELRKKVTPNQKKKIMDAVENGILSRVPFLNRMYNVMDLRINKYMSRTNVHLLLNESGFEVVNMTGINGLTYFCAKRR